MNNKNEDNKKKFDQTEIKIEAPWHHHIVFTVKGSPPAQCKPDPVPGRVSMPCGGDPTFVVENHKREIIYQQLIDDNDHVWKTPGNWGNQHSKVPYYVYSTKKALDIGGHIVRCKLNVEEQPSGKLIIRFDDCLYLVEADTEHGR